MALLAFEGTNTVGKYLKSTCGTLENYRQFFQIECSLTFAETERITIVFLADFQQKPRVTVLKQFFLSYLKILKFQYFLIVSKRSN